MSKKIITRKKSRKKSKTRKFQKKSKKNKIITYKLNTKFFSKKL